MELRRQEDCIEIESSFTIRNALYPRKNSAVYLVSCPFFPVYKSSITKVGKGREKKRLREKKNKRGHFLDNYVR